MNDPEGAAVDVLVLFFLGEERRKHKSGLFSLVREVCAELYFGRDPHSHSRTPLDQPPAPRKRRVRYRGTHPRRFEEKYKELQPERYSQDVQKVMERGQTPAGTHRSVLVNEVLEALEPRPGEIGLDATLGYGGHAVELLKRITPGGRLVGIDVDPVELPRTEARLRDLGFTPEMLVVRRMNFAGIQRLLADSWEGFDFILADLGVSSMQIDNPQRGFTFKHDGPLDLRLNPQKGHSASSLLQSTDEDALAALLKENADEPYAAVIARAVKAHREPIDTTALLGSIVQAAVESAVRGPDRLDEVKAAKQRVFQALRIAVNDEFGALDRFLEQLQACLKPGGRVAVLSFHSGEDRRVKKSFVSGLRCGLYERVAPDVVRASSQERHDNPRSACVKMRWAVRGR